jgi:hypothetical protein
MPYDTIYPNTFNPHEEVITWNSKERLSLYLTTCKTYMLMRFQGCMTKTARKIYQTRSSAKLWRPHDD